MKNLLVVSALFLGLNSGAQTWTKCTNNLTGNPDSNATTSGCEQVATTEIPNCCVKLLANNQCKYHGLVAGGSCPNGWSLIFHPSCPQSSNAITCNH